MGNEGRKEVMGAAMHDGNHACTATAGAEAMLSNSRELALSVVSYPPPLCRPYKRFLLDIFLPKGTSTTVGDALSIEHYHFNLKSISACATVHHPRKKIP